MKIFLLFIIVIQKLTWLLLRKFFARAIICWHTENTYFSWQKASAIAECHRKFWRLIYSWNVYEILICLYESVGHSIWNHLTFLTWPPWILLKFCQLNLTIQKWKYWKFYYFIMCSSEIMTTQSMDSLAWISSY